MLILLNNIYTACPKSEPGQKNFWMNIAIGKNHGFICAEDGSAWAIGYGGSGQLGLPVYVIVNAQNPNGKSYTDDKSLPFNYEFSDIKSEHNSNSSGFSPLLTEPLEWTKPPYKSILKVACGKYHTLFLTDSRQVLSSGLFLNGRLGLGNGLIRNINKPTIIRNLSNIVDISCGRDFSLALNSSGAIFSWGSDGHGCLGNGTSRADQWDPGVLHDIPEMACVLAGQIHCGAITKRGKIYMWGSGEHGQLGLKLGPGEKIVLTPKLVSHSSITKKKIISLALGKYHTVALTQGLDVYSWGTNERGQLGISMPMSSIMQRSIQIYPPTLIRMLVGKGIFKIACGKNHSCGLSLSGLLYTWGENRNGQLGHQLELPTQEIPMIVKTLAGKPLSNVYAAYDYTIMIQDSDVDLNRHQNYFDLWRSTLVFEDQKETQKDSEEQSPEELKDNKIIGKGRSGKAEKIRKKSPGRRKAEVNGPILVTSTEKVYRFRRYKGDDTCVTIFTDKEENYNEGDSKLREIYEKFWLQNHPAYKPKNNGEIFFADKDPNEELIE